MQFVLYNLFVIFSVIVFRYHILMKAKKFQQNGTYCSKSLSGFFINLSMKVPSLSSPNANMAIKIC